MKPGVVAGFVFVAIVAGVVVWRLQERAPQPTVAETAVLAPASAPPPPPSAVAQAASPPPLPPVAPSEAIAADDVPGAIEGLVGKPGLAAFRLDDFAHRVVAYF